MWRKYSHLDHIIIQIDHCLQALGSEQPAEREYPAKNLPPIELSEADRRQSAGYMRVNHCGEVCAQALYNAQALMAKKNTIRTTLLACGKEEADHLAWCNTRLKELNSHRSYLNIFWYWGAFSIGLSAGLVSDAFSLGFVEETEIQVGKHLQSHLDRLSPQDQRSKRIIEQMQQDEANHAATAQDQGAQPLPRPIKKMMSIHSKIMTTLAYWI